MTFLKGSQLKKSILKNEHPDLFYHFQDVWNVQNNHNQKRRHAKAASTRQRKKNSTCNRADVSRKHNDALRNQDAYNCTTCGVAYAEDEGKFWIARDSCSNWYCASCENLAEEPKSETYTCKHCSPPHCV